MRLTRIFVLWTLLGCFGVAGWAGEIPDPDLTHASVRVQKLIHDARAQVASSPGDGSVWGQFGMVLEAHLFFEPAAVAYQEAHRLAPEEFRWPYFAASLHDFRDPEQSAKWYEKALAVDGSYAPLHIRFAEVLEKLGRTADARDHFKRAVSLDETNDLAHLGLGRHALANDDLQGALRHLERAYQLGPRQQSIVATLARARHLAGDREGARQLAAASRDLPRLMHHKDALRASVQDLAIDREAVLRRANTALEVGQADRAATDLRQFLEDEPGDAEVWFMLASAAERLARPVDTEAAARRALELDGSLDGAQVLLASSLLRLGRIEESQRVADAGLKQRPQDLGLLVVRTMVAAQRGDTSDLLYHLDRAFDARTNDRGLRQLIQTLLVEVGDSLASVGQFPAAAERLEKALVMAREETAPSQQISALEARLVAYRAGRSARP